MANKEKFLSLVSPTNKKTQEDMCFRNENRGWLRESKMIAVKVLKALKEQGLSQKDLAMQMGVSPQYINKLVKGKENFTLETQVKLQQILDIPLLASYYENKKTDSEYQNSVQMFSYRVAYKRSQFEEYDPLYKEIG